MSTTEIILYLCIANLIGVIYVAHYVVELKEQNTRLLNRLEGVRNLVYTHIKGI